MNAAHRIWSFLPRGIREPLAVLLILGVIARVGIFFGTWELYSGFAFWPTEFWRGRVWQLATYPWLPWNIADVIFNGFFFALLGTRLVHEFGRGRFWIYCCVAVLGTAAMKLALTPFNRGGLVGIGGVVFALFAAWCRLFRNEEVMLMGAWRTTMRVAMLITAGIIVLFGLMCPCGFWNTIATIGGGAAGWLYLAVQSRRFLERPAQPLPSDRIRRLEL